MSKEVVRVRTDKEMYNAIINNNIPVLDSDAELYKNLENVGNDIPDEFKLNLKACKNIRFSRDLILYVDRHEENRFRELYEFVDYYYRNEDVFSSDRHENKFRNVYLVFDFDEEKEKNEETVKKFKEEFFDTIQQLIYLDIHIDVYTKGFLRRKVIVESFNKEYKLFEELVNGAIKKVGELSENEAEIQSIKSLVLENLKKIQELLKHLESEIKVAVFATKKTGKSMVVNGLIGEELAPTSLELPTPCNILFTPSKEDKIIVRDEEGKQEFSDAHEAKNYLRKKFEGVKEKGHRLPDIEIVYPYERYKGKKYKIYDTPGPDLVAKDEAMGHSDIYKTALTESDVAVFVIDYTKYAQGSEVKLLESIKSEFENRNMVLICAVNKIDQVFNDADSEKMTIRIADFIRVKYKEIGYRHIIVIPISAMAYFYLHKLADRSPDIKEDFVNALNNIKKEVLQKSKEKAQTDQAINENEYKTYLNAIKNLANSLETFYEIEASYKSIIDFSGFEFFEKYIERVAYLTARVEKVYSVITEIYIRHTAIKNEVENRLKVLKMSMDNIGKFSQEIEKFGDEDLKKIEDEVNKLKEGLYKTENKLKKAIEEILKKSLKRAKKSSKDILKERLKDVKEKFLDEDKYKNIISKEITVERFFEELKESILSEALEPSLEIEPHIKEGVKSILDVCNYANEEVNKEVGKFIEELRDKVSELNRKFSELLEKPEGELGELEVLSLPAFAPEINLSEIQESIQSLSGYDYYELLFFSSEIDFEMKVKEETEGFYNWLRKIFLKEDIIKELKESLEYEFDNDMKEKVMDYHDEVFEIIEEKLDKEIDKIIDGINKHFKSFKDILDDYLKSTFDVVKKMIADTKREEEEKKNIIDILERVENSVKPLQTKLEDIIKDKTGEKEYVE
ncbi:MAG: dynamin family protein [Candidatus Aenigmatarchaeota archaeon]